jgi:hypothetical protein
MNNNCNCGGLDFLTCSITAAGVPVQETTAEFVAGTQGGATGVMMSASRL